MVFATDGRAMHAEIHRGDGTLNPKAASIPVYQPFRGKADGPHRLHSGAELEHIVDAVRAGFFDTAKEICKHGLVTGAFAHFELSFAFWRGRSDYDLWSHMGFDFHNSKGGYVSLNWSGWRMVFELAQMYGWNPAGTEPPAGPPEGVEVMYFDMADAQVIGNIKRPDTESADDYRPSKPWAGGYFSSDWQYVTEADASALAAALERAMPELPDEDLCPVKKMKLIDRRGREMELEVLAENAEDDPKLFWSGPENKAYLRKFIDLCKQGRFAIG